MSSSLSPTSSKPDEKSAATANVRARSAHSTDEEAAAMRTPPRSSHHQMDRTLHLKAADADEAAAYATGRKVSEEEGRRVRRKADMVLMPLMMVLYWIQFQDKTTLGSSSILGIRQDTRLSSSEYNMLSTIFYISYLVFEWPQSVALQRLPIGKWLATNITIWGIVLICHAACTNFAGLFVCRLFLGACEGAITAGFLLVTSQFYTLAEQARRFSFVFLQNGTAIIVSGLMSYGVLHAHTAIAPWRLYMIITGSFTFVLGIVFFLFFPDSPTTAWFLSKEERATAVDRIRENQTGVGNKHWKRYQFIEALKDWKTWAFFMFSLLDNIPNSLTNQYSIIINSFGFSTLQTTLLNLPIGFVEVLTISSGAFLAGRWKNALVIISAIYFIPNGRSGLSWASIIVDAAVLITVPFSPLLGPNNQILGSILVLSLPSSNKVGLLCSLYITGVGTTGFVFGISMLNSNTAGHTKKATTNAINLIGYCLGNLIGPQMWLSRWLPRNRPQWATIVVCYTICPIILLCVRFALIRENKRRDALAAAAAREQGWAATSKAGANADGEGGNLGETEKHEEHERGEGAAVIEVVSADGTRREKVIDKAFADLTDRENLDFRYIY